MVGIWSKSSGSQKRLGESFLILLVVKNTLDSHISSLLYYHECVVVPGFGAFLTRSYPAVLNSSINMLRPPSTQVAFNGRISDNDGLLAKHVAQREGISYRQSLESIQISVSSWQRILRAGKKINLYGIGRLFLDEEGTLQFNPGHDINYNRYAYGLYIFRATAMERDQKIKQSVNRAIEKQSRSSQASANPPRDRDDQSTRSVWNQNRRQLTKWAAVLGPVVALGLLGGYYLSQQPQTFQNVAGLVENVMQAAPPDSSQASEESKLFDTGVENKNSPASPVSSGNAQDSESPEPSAELDEPEKSSPLKKSEDLEFEGSEEPYHPTDLDANINHSLYNVKPRPEGSSIPSEAQASSSYTPNQMEDMEVLPQSPFDLPRKSTSDKEKIREENPKSKMAGPSEMNNDEEAQDSPMGTMGDWENIMDSEEEPNADRETSPSTPASSTKSANLYQVVVGSFSQDANAQRYVEQLRSQGFEAYTEASAAQTRVLIGRFKDARKAQNHLNQVRLGVNAQAWLKGTK